MRAVLGLVVCLFVVILAFVMSKEERPPAPVSADSDARTPEEWSDRIDDLVIDEEMLLALTPQLRAMQASLGNLEFPDPARRDLFVDPVSVVDVSIAEEVDPAQSKSRLGIQRRKFASGSVSEARRDELSLWRSAIQDLAYFENVSFFLVAGSFTGEMRQVYRGDVGCSALARKRDGSMVSINARADVDWVVGNSDATEIPDRWRISAFKTKSMELSDVARSIYRESLDEAVVDAAVVRRARRSIHEQKLIEMHKKGGAAMPDPRFAEAFSIAALGQHPAVSVVDLENDGDDDVFFMDRWGKNIFLLNRGDGTFNDAAERLGLDIQGLCTSAAFGDFDNDGDPDVFIGRSLDRSLYFENRVSHSGRFVDRTTEVAPPLPSHVAAISAADYDKDGLLDVYFATYAIPGRELKDPEYAARFHPKEVVDRLFADAGNFQYYKSIGAPNLLLANRGGRFDVAPHNADVEGWSNTFQATWADYDNDNDPDLYLANDYGPDLFYRNDLENGFAEISRELAGDAMSGFGMGASFGDYDNDGRQDLYVSNMFSKAGKRILARLPEVDKRLVWSAAGNLLFRNHVDRFELVSGDKPALPVYRAGWAWGGQFGDVDNDGFQDIYASSGYYTAPEVVAVDFDL